MKTLYKSFVRRLTKQLARRVAALILPVSCFFTMAAYAQTCPIIPVGGNTVGVSYYSSAVQFKDLMFQGSLQGVTKIADGSPCTGVVYDSDGWPNIPLNCRQKIWAVFHIYSGNWAGTTIKPYKPGSYVLLYDGKGDVTLGWDAKNAKVTSPGRITFDVPAPKDGLELYVTNKDATDYIRNIRIVHVSDEATYAQQPFTEEYLNMYRRMGATVLRFMDASGASSSITVWSGNVVSRTGTTLTLPAEAPSTIQPGQIAIVADSWARIFVKEYNYATRTITLESTLDLTKTPANAGVTILDFPNRTWEARTQVGSLFQRGPGGLALEYMIQMANILKADPWLSIPPAADDNWIREAAKLFKTKLDPSLKPYFEWGNESWNFGYPAYHYSEAMMRRLGIGTGVWIPADAYQPYRFIEMTKIISSVYGVSELAAERKEKPFYAVLTSQTAWTDRARAVMDWSRENNGYPTMGHKAYEFADDFAVTFYWSKPDGSKGVADSTISELIQAQIDNQNALMKATAPVGYQFAIADEVIKRGMRLVSYEAGTHLLADDTDDTAQVDKLMQVNRDPRMKDVFLNALNLWQGLRERFGTDKVGVFNQYSMVGQYSRYGYWGQMESSFQDPATAPKHQAFMEWDKKCPPPQSPSNVRLVQE